MEAKKKKYFIATLISNAELNAFIINILKTLEFRFIPFSEKSALIKEIKNNNFAILAIVYMNDYEQIYLISEIKKAKDGISIIVLTNNKNIDFATECIRKGADDILTEPIAPAVIIKEISKIIEMQDYRIDLEYFKKALAEKHGFNEIIAISNRMKEILERAYLATRSDAPVLIMGESGTGKELLARAIHLNSHRGNKPFIPLNCAAIPKELLESELFGYKKGAFTGAVSNFPGIFLAANDGTVFLDEISEMPKESQAKLLRVLENKEIRQLGSMDVIKVDIRIMAATNQPLEKIRKEYLREDLYFRLSIIKIELPPLRERIEDIPILCSYFINKYSSKYKSSIKSISPRALEILMDYDFPGNIRELENIIHSVISVAPINQEEIKMKDIIPLLSYQKVEEDFTEILNIKKAQKYLIQQALSLSKGNKTRAAKLLGISRDKLYRKLKEYNLN